jgi:hypothetical protein
MSTWRAALRMSGVPPCCGVREVSYKWEMWDGRRRARRRRPVLSASIVRNSRTVVNGGKLYIFINLSTCVRATISSTFVCIC